MVEGNREKRRMKKGENKRGKKRKRNINIILYAFFISLIRVALRFRRHSFFCNFISCFGFSPLISGEK